jgi:hypothetical protein
MKICLRVPEEHAMVNNGQVQIWRRAVDAGLYRFRIAIGELIGSFITTPLPRTCLQEVGLSNKPTSAKSGERGGIAVWRHNS